MSRIPQWQKDGWLPGGYRRCRCPKCGKPAYTNNRSRAKHVCLPEPPQNRMLRVLVMKEKK